MRLTELVARRDVLDAIGEIEVFEPRRLADVEMIDRMQVVIEARRGRLLGDQRAAALMPNGGSMITLTYNGGDRAMPNYNVMGLAKAALESSVRYLAVDFGPQKIRVNAISAGPIRTLAGAGINDARYMFAFQQRHSPLRRGVTLEEIGSAALYLLSDLSTGVTGDIHFVDSGYNIITMPQPSMLKNGDEAQNGATDQPIKDAAQ